MPSLEPPYETVYFEGEVVSLSMGPHIYCYDQTLSLDLICQQSECAAMATGIISMIQRSNLMPKLQNFRS